MIPPDLVPENCPWPVVLGLDPGTLCAGYGAIVVAPDGPRLLTCGIFQPPRALPIAQRLGRIQAELEELLAALRPSHVAIEGGYGAPNIKSALRLGEARGMMLATCGRRGLAIVEIPPASAKRAVVGTGSGSKEQVAAMVWRHLDRAPEEVPEDATDALAVALAHVRRNLTGIATR